MTKLEFELHYNHNVSYRMPARFCRCSGILAKIADRAEESRFPLTPQRIVHDVRLVMPEEGIVCLDNGMYKIWFARNYRTHAANTLLLERSSGCLARSPAPSMRH